LSKAEKWGLSNRKINTKVKVIFADGVHGEVYVECKYDIPEDGFTFLYFQFRSQAVLEKVMKDLYLASAVKTSAALMTSEQVIEERFRFSEYISQIEDGVYKIRTELRSK